VLGLPGENSFGCIEYEGLIILQKPVLAGNFFDNWLDCLTTADFNWDFATRIQTALQFVRAWQPSKPTFGWSSWQSLAGGALAAPAA